MGRKHKRDYILPKGVYAHGRRFRLRIYVGPERRPAWHTFKANTLEKLYREYGRYLGTKGLLTMADIMDRYAAQEIPHKARDTQTSDLAALRQLRPVFGTMRPQGIRRQHVVAYLDNRGAVAPFRANRERALLSHILTKATHWGILDDNPILALQYRCPEAPRSRYVTDAQLFRASMIAPPLIRYVMRLAYLTGLRRRDILSLRWDDLSEDGVQVTLSKSKRAGVAPKRLCFEWSISLDKVFCRVAGIGVQAEYPRPWLWPELAARAASDYVFPVPEKGFARAWTEFQNQVERKGIERFQLKDLRAKHATDAAARGLDATERMAHSSAATTRRHYTQRRPTRIKL